MSDRANQAPDRARVFTVPAGLPFLQTLSGAILDGSLPGGAPSEPDPLDLARWTLLLPTRRARRAMAQAFLDRAGGARFLPRIRAIGDPEEDELLWPGEEAEPDLPDLPPAISPIRRLFLLAGLLRDWAEGDPRRQLARAIVHSPAQTVALARSLAGLVDSCDIEGRDLDGIAALLEQELAGHQQAALDFLAIVRVRLPEAMEALGCMQPMRRRNRLLALEAERLAATPSAFPVIAAGSTGSIPATATLLATIARMQRGAVVLPGLDLGMDADSWACLAPQHPQYGMAELLKRIGVEREEVRVLAAAERPAASRFWLASEIMRPVETTDRWHDQIAAHAATLREGIAGVELVEAPDQREEALSIALIMRRTLETPGRTCALVTPDRRLARRVKTELRRWNIAVDDTAGEPLIRRPAGAFAGLLVEAAASGFEPLALASLLDHPLCRMGERRADLVRAARTLELAVLRGGRPSERLAGLPHAVEAARDGMDVFTHPALRRIGAGDWAAALRLADRLGQVFAPLEALFDREDDVPLAELLAAHAAAAEAAAEGPDGATLWRGEDGAVLSAVFSELLAEAPHLPAFDAADYPGFIGEFMALSPVRPSYGRHPRLSILGLLEARLVDADVTVLGGLDEGVWPPASQSDPWLNRPQRRKLGLPVPERRIGLAAHDFVQAFCRPDVHLTWSRKVGSEPAVPSRWIMRLRALLKAARTEAAPAEPWIAWAQALDRADALRPIVRPEPRPPLSLRPKTVSVTRVEELMRDPYAAYARHVLRLKPLDALGAELGAADRGQIVHATLQAFTANAPGALPADALARFMAEADAALAAFGVDDATAGFWRPQLENMGRWFIELEGELRKGVTAQVAEIRGVLPVGAGEAMVRLTAVADRIDRLSGGGVRIVDYKTGALPSFEETARGYSPQVLFEALMAGSGAFAELGPEPAREILYIRLTGGDPAGECRALSGPKLEQCVEAARLGLERLFAAYGDEHTPYRARDWSDKPDGERDYGHLSRWREWSAAMPGTDAP